VRRKPTQPIQQQGIDLSRALPGQQMTAGGQQVQLGVGDSGGDFL
jgi:hypothetical protein